MKLFQEQNEAAMMTTVTRDIGDGEVAMSAQSAPPRILSCFLPGAPRTIPRYAPHDTCFRQRHKETRPPGRTTRRTHSRKETKTGDSDNVEMRFYRN